MTGFGRGTSQSATKKICVEIKSLNSKQFDISMRIPQSLRELEVEARNRMAAELERGKVDVNVTIENLGGETQAQINIPLLAAYKQQIEQLRDSLKLEEPVDWYTLLMRMPEAMHIPTPQLSEDDSKAFFEACTLASHALMQFRAQEGKKLYDFFVQKIANIRGLLSQVDPFEAERVVKIRTRLEEQLAKMTSIEYEKGRLEQELIFYIEKLDVNEEKLRLRSHLDYFMETLGEDGVYRPGQPGQGKKLGFIAQEMGREINTLGSKSNHADMQKLVVMMKDELEQIKEQVLNVM